LAGIYIHIPFCKQKCHYCNFYSTVSLRYRDVFVDALKREISIRKDYLGDQTVNTIYFGGGTPSMLETSEITEIIEILSSTFNINNDPEITLEANPDDISPDYLLKLKRETPVNRLSIGIQSFSDEDLKYLYRVHDSKRARKSIEESLNAGFSNLTIDLIYGIPTLTDDVWYENLKIFFGYNIPHLSSYSLTVEQKTALDILIKKKKLQNISEEKSIRHFEILLAETENHGFVNYEISNFAVPGYYSKHNSIYWLGDHYLGLGPFAHSYNGKSRQWNVMSVKKYCENEPSRVLEETEILTKDQIFNEYILTSIRTSWGCDIEHIKNVFGQQYLNHFLYNIEKYIKQKKVISKGNQYTLSNMGKLFADAIASDLFYNI
jgi:oxygen-independent coproporphyrinogen-3 oxidase